jgi:hypothetical protein
MKIQAELVVAIAAVLAISGTAIAQVPNEIAATGESTVVTVHAEGAQIYECKAASDGKLAWTFREPIAALLLDGKTVGRHYAGPTWEYADGSVVMAKVAANAPGKSASDIPWLKLAVTEHRGNGMLSGVTTVQRINTQGGTSPGSCNAAASFQSVAYSADYVFLKK